ncbi:MAG: amidohydrolase family protein [Proteobacteria bacterium]|jgi:imidazolonepropionase-like amidohydrolase|nr:amidohydrolase family protein [Pseudomonadota bacterium]
MIILRSLLVTIVLCITNMSFAANPEVAIVHAGTLLVTPGEEPVYERSIIIRNGVIGEVRRGFVEPELTTTTETIQVIDLRDSFVMAGMVDTHVHLTIDPSRTDLSATTNSDLAVLAAANARTTLMSGVTTVRDLQSANAEAIFAVRDAVATGMLAGPTIIAAGESVSATGGHGDRRMLRTDIAELLQTDSICDGADDCTRAVRAQYRKGADVIKVHATGGGADSNGKQYSVPEMTDAELRAVVETAHALGLKVAAHAHGTEGIRSALRAGVDSVEHASWVDKDIISLFLSTGAALVRTAYLQDYFLSRENIPEELQESRRDRNELMDPGMLEAITSGVMIVMGSDAGIMPHGLSAREVVKYVGLGMSPMQAIETATINAAVLLGMEEKIGQIKPGFHADIIALPSSPLEDISQLENVKFVMKAGVVYLDSSD